MLNLNRKFVVFLAKILSKKHLRLVEENLKIAFPKFSKEQHSKLLNDTYSHFSMIFLEIITLYIKKKPERILKHIEVKNLQVLKSALKKKRGVILFSAHFGNWELVPYILSRKLNTKIVSIAR
jgi:KDO2-lipid IV(A) lauroyltransferase